MHKNNNLREKTILGFWLYMMSDCILFASLFAMYAVLCNNTAGSYTGKEIFSLSFVFIETCCLLSSSLTYGITVTFAKKLYIKETKLWMIATFLLGLLFISMEIYEFYHLIKIGSGPQISAFLSSFFILIGTHGLHVIIGLIWIIVIFTHIFYHGLTYINQIRLECLSLFWHFLDIIWICVFTEVYLIGMI